jgi:methyl-accepting chemotaxis protein
MKWYKNMKISLKLIIGFFIVAIISVIVGIIGLTNIRKISTASESLFSENLLGVSYIGRAATDFQRLRYNALKLTTAETLQEIEAQAATLQELNQSVDALLAKYEKTVSTGDARTMYEALLEQWTTYDEIIDKAVQYVSTGDIDKTENAILVDGKSAGDTLRETFLELMKMETADAEAT